MFITVAGFSQKSKGTPDSTARAYLTYSCSMHPQYVYNMEEKCPVCDNTMNLSKKELMKREVVKLYSCSMHPNVVSTKAGKCPVCAMELAKFKPPSKTN